jgi:hypothetical protein
MGNPKNLGPKSPKNLQKGRIKGSELVPKDQ